MSYHPSDDEPRDPRGCACHFEMPGHCPGRHNCPMCQEDSEPDVAWQFSQWLDKPDLRLAAIRFLIDQAGLEWATLEQLQKWTTE